MSSCVFPSSLMGCFSAVIHTPWSPSSRVIVESSEVGILRRLPVLTLCLCNSSFRAVVGGHGGLLSPCRPYRPARPHHSRPPFGWFLFLVRQSGEMVCHVSGCPIFLILPSRQIIGVTRLGLRFARISFRLHLIVHNRPVLQLLLDCGGWVPTIQLHTIQADYLVSPSPFLFGLDMPGTHVRRSHIHNMSPAGPHRTAGIYAPPPSSGTGRVLSSVPSLVVSR